jgi:uncharacterized membrane protein
MPAEPSNLSSEGTGQEPSSKPSRLLAVDALRGLIIVFMALDHANHFIAQKHSSGEIWDGVFPVYYDTLTFLTRFVTHFAAPGFFLLMGVGMFLFARSRTQRGWSRWAIIRHFLVRGSLLMVLQLLIVNRAWELSPQGWDIMLYFGVLFALGATMVLGSLLLWLKPVYLLALTLILFVGTELLHPGLGMWNSVSHSPVSVIHLYPGGNAVVWSYYSIWPWMELVIFGIFFGNWLAQDPRKAFSRAWKLGLAFLLAFVVIRYFDGFGNIRPRMSNSWIDFLNPVKYPPSMTFTLMTTGRVRPVAASILRAAPLLVRRNRLPCRPTGHQHTAHAAILATWNADPLPALLLVRAVQARPPSELDCASLLARRLHVRGTWSYVQLR